MDGNVTPAQDIKTKIFFWSLFVIILLSASATYYRYVVLEDFTVVETPVEEAVEGEAIAE